MGPEIPFKSEILYKPLCLLTGQFFFFLRFCQSVLQNRITNPHVNTTLSVWLIKSPKDTKLLNPQKPCELFSHVRLLATTWIAPARLLCLWNSSRQEYWSELPCPPPGDLPDPWIKLRSLALQADSLLFEPPGKPLNPWNP